MGKLKILVTGKQGQLGNALQELSENQFEFTWKFTDRSELDITDSIKIQSVLKKFQPDWIINAAAYTDVDGAEFNQEIADFDIELDELDGLSETLEKRYKKQFTAMETAISSLKNTGEFMTNLMDSFNKD